MHKVYLSLGSNLGDRKYEIKRAVELIGERIGAVERVSSLYETEPWGFSSDNMFVNAAVCVSTQLTPRALLEATQAIERDMGRTAKSVNGQYHDRTIDIDILIYDNIKVDEPDLKIPHPLMNERDFVMKPLKEILA
ncbi:2-amino-4-hydroxy-6-hydroxymethyldihydropteridine diphosphokinase [uncultured Prevotella sp.]|mgnify:FL=1|uniref:2-amino-4-hydroxy-6- hydroxymethyldihydropteridine diphosphokinase n=1 Tax=uncultured Prevotella sp. TaxID=159272 RepID=UPI0025DB6847|nr:2-amino-4-hydroxy-6-hydroxymethyldihydropteridine diphosphokinase [uncultured Prevotella sp.]